MRSTMIKVGVGVLLVLVLVAARFPVRGAMGWDAAQVRQLVLTVVIIGVAAVVAGVVVRAMFPERFRKRRRW